MTNSVILSGARTPFGKLNGALASKSTVELGVIASKEAIARAGVDRDEITHVYMGQVIQGGSGQNPARQVGLNVGLDRTVTADTVNRVCGSGMRAIELADQAIRLGDHQVVLAGGMESMSQAPHILRGARAGFKAGNGQLEDLVFTDGLTCAQMHVPMGRHGSDVAAEEGVGRQSQDAWALRSHELAVRAQESGRLAREIVPVDVVERKSTKRVEYDEAPRSDTSLEALAKLKPAFGESSTVTAGNAPGINDGGSAVIVANADWAREHGHQALATIVATGQSAWDPPYLAYTPAMAIEQALKRAGLTVNDLDLVEINEAFASVALIATQRLGVDPDRVNVNGGAIALGHPLAASGPRLLITLIESLRERGGGIGAAALCSGGGQGDAMIVRVEAA